MKIAIRIIYIYNSLKEINILLEDNYTNKKYNKEKSKTKINKINKILKKNPNYPLIHNKFQNEEKNFTSLLYKLFF